MDEKEVFGKEILKLAKAEVDDSRSLEEARERLQRLIARFEERTMTEIYAQIMNM